MKECAMAVSTVRCDIIIPIWNQFQYTKECVESIARNTAYPYRLILVDNGSEPETCDYLKSLTKDGSKIVLIRNEENLGFVKAVNQGLKASDAPYVCLLNNDTIPAPGWLERLVEFAESHKDAGLLNPVCDGHLDTPIDEYAKRLEANKGRYMEMNQCFGFCMLMKRELINKIGYLDETFGIGGFDDTDYSMRAHKAGYCSVCVHDAYVYHKQHVSFKAMGDRKKLVFPGEKAYFNKWPRHLRIGISFPVNDCTREEDIRHMLDGILLLAREWCWVNLWVLGDKDRAKAKIEEVSKKAGMPLHQNIKFNYFPEGFSELQVLIRLLERSFGTKARKHYDAVLVPDEKMAVLLRAFRFLHRTGIYTVAFSGNDKTVLESIMSKARQK
jgi:GT2 family glycosyltransferase